MIEFQTPAATVLTLATPYHRHERAILDALDAQAGVGIGEACAHLIADIIQTHLGATSGDIAAQYLGSIEGTIDAYAMAEMKDQWERARRAEALTHGPNGVRAPGRPIVRGDLVSFPDGLDRAVFTIPPGTTGCVVEVRPDLLSVFLYDHIDGAQVWDNCANFILPEDAEDLAFITLTYLRDDDGPTLRHLS